MNCIKFKVSVTNNGVTHKYAKSKGDGNSEIFTTPLDKETYWKVAYDINRMGHTVAKTGGVVAYVIEELDDTGTIVTNTQIFTHRQLAYNEIRSVTKDLKRYNARKVPERIVNNFKHSKKTTIVEITPTPIIPEPVIEIENADRKTLMALAKELGIKNYHDKNMATLRTEIVARKTA